MGYREHPNRKCISGSDGGLIPARSRDHTGLWLLSVAKLIAKVRTFAADFCSKESPAEPMTGKPLQNLRVLQWLAELHFLFGCSPEPKLDSISRMYQTSSGRSRPRKQPAQPPEHLPRFLMFSLDRAR